MCDQVVAVELSPGTLAILCAVSLLAGAVDAIAGGGGLLTVPALLAAGLPPQLALGTNKGQSVFGALAALARYARSGLVDRRLAVLTFPAGGAGALLGAALLLRLDPSLLRPLVLTLLVIAGAVVAFRRPASQGVEPPRARHGGAAAGGIALAIGAYDGFFGPGTGTFLLLAFVGVLGLTMPRATAEAKVVNFASNLAALGIFAHRGTVLWSVALPMAAGQLVGGWLGAHLAVRGGERIIRRAVLAIVIALVVKLGRDLFG
ncbi:MAG: TSUP family transporter [Myxococcales bacterium]|nr:TSUP family transporter [Myxococcales bacterium]